MMKLRRTIVLLLMCMFLTISGAHSALAQDPSPEGEFVLDEIVVTATKTGETNLQETPIAISVYDDEAMKTRSSFRLDDLALFTPNVEINDNFYFVRGIGNQRDWATVEAQVSVYIDGVFLPRGLGSQTDLFDVERVEILRGPQGTLYGQNSTGGSINIISKKPTDELSGIIALEAGNYEKWRLDATVSGPIVKDTLNGRLTIRAENAEAYLDVVGGDATEQDFSTVALRAALDFNISDTASFILRADYEDQESEGDIGKLLAVGPFSLEGAFLYSSPPGFYDVTRNRETYRRIDQWGASGELKVDLSFGTLKSLTAYREYEGEDLEDHDKTSLDFAIGYELEDNKWFSQELQLYGASDRLNWLVGAYYYWHEELYDVWFAFPDLAPGFTSSMYGDYSASAFALFATVDYQITDQFNIGIGARYSYNDREMWFDDNYLGYQVYTADGDWSGFTPKLIAEYQVNDDAMIYATVGKGFRAGTVDPANPAAGFPALIDEETVWNYEMGVKTDWLDKRLRLNASAFYMDYNDMVMEYATFVNGQLANLVGTAADVEISGFELEALAMPVPAMTLHFSIGTLSNEMTQFVDALDPLGNPFDASGNDLPFVPELTYSLGAQYVFTLGNAGFLTVRADVTHRNEQFSDIANSDVYELESLTLVNAFIRYETADARWSLDLYGKNLADEEYRTAKFPGWFGSDIGFQGAPLVFGARVSYTF